MSAISMGSTALPPRSRPLQLSVRHASPPAAALAPTPARATSRPRASARQPASAREVVVVVGLVLLAAALRWPNYLEVPAFNDEMLDVIRSALLYRNCI